jgi:F-type H+-transporting ATPase subunit b
MSSHVEPLIHLGWTLLMVLITFIVLYLILKKYFFEKVHLFMQARQHKVIDAFDNAEQVNKVADERLSEYNGKLEAMDEQSRVFLRESRQKAEARAAEIIETARKEAAALQSKARQEIERERVMAIESMREQVALLAIYAAEKILEKQLDETEHQAVIRGAIDEVGKGQWQN